jgi:hypothetical protein
MPRDSAKALMVSEDSRSGKIQALAGTATGVKGRTVRKPKAIS